MAALNLSMKSSHLTITAIAKKLMIFPSSSSFTSRDHPEMRVETKKRITSLIKNDNEPILLAQCDNAINAFDPKIELSKYTHGSKNPLKPVNC